MNPLPQGWRNIGRCCLGENVKRERKKVRKCKRK
jgi:hypothetical protein